MSSNFLKNGSKCDVTTYRLISIIFCILQILEKHLLRVMNAFLLNRGVLSDHQYSFVSEQGTQVLLEK